MGFLDDFDKSINVTRCYQCPVFLVLFYPPIIKEAKGYPMNVRKTPLIKLKAIPHMNMGKGSK